MRELEKGFVWSEENQKKADDAYKAILWRTHNMQNACDDEEFYTAYKRRKEQIRELLWAVGINRHGWP